MIQGDDIFDKKDGGVYGLFQNDQLIYIGSTRKFETRLYQHNNGILYPEKYPTMVVYKNLKETDQIIMRPLISIKDLHCEGFTSKDILEQREGMEGALIHTFKPKYNQCGVTMPGRFHRFKNKKKKNLEYKKQNSG